MTKEEIILREENRTRAAAMHMFEKDTADWGFDDYEREINRDTGLLCYVDNATGVAFGGYLMGFEAACELYNEDLWYDLWLELEKAGHIEPSAFIHHHCSKWNPA